MLLCKDDTWIDQYLKQYGYSLERQEDQFYAIDSHGQIHLKVGEKIELYGGICPIVVECVPYQKKTQLNILVYEMNKKTKISIFEDSLLQISMQDQTHRIGMDLSLDHIELLEGNNLENRTLNY